MASWQAKADLQINATLYRYAIGNIIRLTPRPAGAFGQVYKNTGNQTGHGMELEGAWALAYNLRLVGNYAWQRSIDMATHTDAGYAPHHHLYARADWRLGNCVLSPQFTWVADRKRPTGDVRLPVADYHTVDLTVSTRRGDDRWNFSATARNLFNADVREPSAAPGLQIPHDLPLAPRALSLQASYQM